MRVLCWYCGGVSACVTLQRTAVAALLQVVDTQIASDPTITGDERYTKGDLPLILIAICSF